MSPLQKALLTALASLPASELSGLAALAKDTGKAKKASPKGKKAKRETPAWLIARGENSAARKALAKSFRDAGKPVPTGAEWVAAKLAAGIK